MKIKIINGPNLNLLGIRQPEVYGSESFESYLQKLRKEYPAIVIKYFQSNSEGAIIDEIQKTLEENIDGIILNAGAYTHYSIAIRDAISAINTKVIEVHISNIFAREEFRNKSIISDVCFGLISGFGLKSYDLALKYFISNQESN